MTMAKNKPCVRCRHAEADHVEQILLDSVTYVCLVEPCDCLHYVEPAPRWMRAVTGFLGSKPAEDDPGAMSGWCPGCDKVHTGDGRLCDTCVTNPGKAP